MNQHQQSPWKPYFPGLQQQVNGKPLVYLDNAATTLKPQSVIQRLTLFNSMEIANVHRGAHFLSDRATELYESARQSVANFINAKGPEEIIFVRGTTEAVNLLASSLGARLQPGDEIILSQLEHHANIVPWQLLAERQKLTLKVIPLTADGEPDFEVYKTLLTDRSRVLALTHCSNHIGTIVDIKPFINLAKRQGVFTVIDGAQMVGKAKVDMQDLDCDFYCFSGHKTFAPFGIGVLFGKNEILQTLPPYQGGGSMISKVSFSGTSFADSPMRFEAGTPNVEGAIGLHAAFDFLREFSWSQMLDHEESILKYATTKLASVPGLKILGSPRMRAPILAFNIEGIHSSDLGFLLDKEGVAVRVGHHCTQPLLQALGITASCRASFSIYNDLNDVDTFVHSLEKIRKLLI